MLGMNGRCQRGLVQTHRERQWPDLFRGGARHGLGHSVRDSFSNREAYDARLLWPNASRDGAQRGGQTVARYYCFLYGTGSAGDGWGLTDSTAV